MPESGDDIPLALGETSSKSFGNASRSYVSREEIEAWAGYCQTSFKTGQDEMVISQWVDLLDSLCLAVSGWIDRFCRRTSFLPHTVVEYHDGRGPSGELGVYRESDRIYFLREQPVISILSVKEDVGGTSSAMSWTERTPRSTSASGDYQVLRRGGEFATIRFHQYVPREGFGNVEITYIAGYDEAHPIIYEVKALVKEMVTNYLEMKKKSQEADVARWQGTDQAADILRELGDSVLDEDLKFRLLPYQRRATLGRPWR
ncbi:MAG: hypothetical protein WC489_07375 [Patescibacteria group bacterium]